MKLNCSCSPGAMLALMAIVMAATAMAIEPPATQPSWGDGDLLAGPAVEAEAQRVGAESMLGSDRRRAVHMPLRQWMGVLREMELTAEQQAEVREITQEFFATQRQHQREHADELRRLTAAAREARQGGSEPDPEVWQSMQRIEAASPRPESYQRRAWNVLTAEQQDRMRLRLDKLQQQLIEQRRRALQRDRDSEMRRGEDRVDQSMRAGDDMAAAEAGDDMTGEMTGDGMNAADNDQPQADRQRAPKRGNRNELDDLGRRRLRFLLSRQATERPGRTPSRDDRRFQFDENAAAER